jgi:hypothetical protein
MRIVLSILSLWFAGIAGCGSASHSPSETTPASGDPPGPICPHICGLGTQCQYPDGRCIEACNPCLCRAGGGRVVRSCRGHAPEPCGNTTCGEGTFCCNASCGICAPLGGFCTQQFCNPGE